jgi:hypothetical protein
MALEPDPGATGKYRLTSVELTTLHDLPHLSGDAGRFLSGQSVRFDPDHFESVEVRSPGTPFQLGYFVKGGVVWGERWEDLAAVTSYAHFERAHRFFHDRLGLAPAVPGALGVAFFPEVTRAPQGGVPEVLLDNAAFFSPLQSFWVLRFRDLHDVPLGMNPGIVAHEYGHAVMNHLAFAGAKVPAFRTAWTDARALNTLYSLDEAFSDAFGSEVTGDPDYLEPSLTAIASSRRLDVFHCYSTEDVLVPGASVPLDDYLDTPPGQYSPYQLGTVIAGAIWSAAAQLEKGGGDRAEIFRAMLGAERDLGAAIAANDGIGADGTGFGLARAVEALAAAASPPARAAICSVLPDRLAPPAAEGGIPSCAGLATERRCPGH